MREAFGAIWSVVALLAGAAVFAGLMWYVARAHSHMWRRVSARYAGRASGAAIVRKAIDTIVVAQRGTTAPFRGAYRVYPGVSISAHEDGLSLSIWPPLNVMCGPIHLPFDEMDLEPTYWALWQEPFAVRMRRLPDVDLILGRDTVQWLRRHANRGPFGLGV